MEQNILGLPGNVFWLWFSALFYLIAILFFLEPFRREKNELMSAFFAFLAGMATFHLLLGAGFYLDNILLVHLGSLSALTGAAFTLKFPLSALEQHLRKPLFYLAMISGWLIIVWMLIFPHDLKLMLWIVLGYMIVFSGGVAGLYIVWEGIKTKDIGVKIKSIGGGVGIITCCLAADSLVLINSLSMVSELWMSIAPLVLILSIHLGRSFQARALVK